MYLLGAPRFQLTTDPKHFLPLFSNPTAKIPPRIERLYWAWICRTATLTWSTSQEKTNMTDYMSRHPLPETGKDHLEKHLRAVIETDHVVVMDKIKQETAKNEELRDWLKPFKESPKDNEVSTRDELYKKKVKNNHDKLRIGDAERCSSSQARKEEESWDTLRTTYLHHHRNQKFHHPCNGKTFCRDASKFKLLRTAKLAAASAQPEEAPARRPPIPRAAPTLTEAKGNSEIAYY